MPRFRYKAVGANGEILEGEMEAPEQNSVINRLQSKGHIPLEATALGPALDRPGTNLRKLFDKHKIQTKDIRILTQELATLLQAGLPLDHALLTLENLTRPGPLQDLIRDIHSKVQGGSTLSSAMQNREGVFSPLYLNMIRAGEISGSLETVFTRLADYLEQTEELRSTVISAMIYPLILLFIAVLSIFALLFFVVPQFIPLFEDAGKALPLPTLMVFGLAEFMKQYWWLCMGCCVMVIWFADWHYRNPEHRLLWHHFFLKIPIIGDLMIKLDVTRFARTMSTLLENGVPLLTSIKIVREVILNKVVSGQMEQVINSLEEGRGLARPLAESGRFPSLVTELIQVGEETGQLERMLTKIAVIYDAESRTLVKRLLTLIEPVLIIGLGALIALIIVSILLAVLSLNELVI